MVVASEVTALRDGVLSPWSPPALLPALLPVSTRVSSDPVPANQYLRRASASFDTSQGARASAGRALAVGGRAGAVAGAAQAGAAAAPVLSIGGRLRVTGEPLSVADAYRARGLAAGPTGLGGASRLGVEWRPAKATFGLEHGAIGMQLDSGYRLSLKVRHGRPSLYLRGKF